MHQNVIEDLLRILRRRKTGGQRCVWLSPATRAALSADSNRPAASRAVAPKRSAGSGTTVRSTVPVPGVAPRGAVPLPRPAAADMPQLPKTGNLEELAALVAQCRACPLHAKRTQTVFGRGAPQARLLFIGEGPGYEEDQQGTPFVGKAGQLLDRMIAAMQFQPAEVYIANIVKCRPPGNRNPEPGEAEACLPYLQRQIEIVRPEVIVLLGAVALQYLLGVRGIMRAHGQWHKYREIPVMPTFHPAYLLRRPQEKRAAWEDLKKVMARLGKAPA